jgi:hypothetical protein
MAAVHLSLELDQRLRLEAVRGEARVLGLGVGRAEAGEMDPDEFFHPLAHPAGCRRVVRWSQKLDIAFLEHHAAVRGAHRFSVGELDRGRRDDEAQALQQPRSRVELGNEMRNVVEEQLAGGGLLPVCNAHEALTATCMSR